jgi:hypothetical protein
MSVNLQLRKPVLPEANGFLRWDPSAPKRLILQDAMQKHCVLLLSDEALQYAVMTRGVHALLK